MPEFLNVATDGKVLKARLIGYGLRRTGTTMNFWDAGPNLKLLAFYDLSEDNLNLCDRRLKFIKVDILV